MRAEMKSHDWLKRRFLRRAIRALAVIFTGLWLATSGRADEPELVAVNILVKDAESDQPVSFARVTLQYQEEGSKIKLKRDKTISLNAKTNLQGRYKFVNIPKGTIRLMVIADQRQTYGQEIEVEQDNQLIEVKLRKPQPIL
jgi:hypothetical protein